MGYCERPSLALSSLAGAGGTLAQTRLFARFLCALSACPRWSSALRSCRSPFAATGFRAHTSCLPTRSGVGALVFAWGWQLGLAVGVFACGWLGFVFTRGACSFGCLRACLCALAWGWWGSVVPPPPCPGLLACLRAHALVWVCWRVRGSACPMGGWRSGRGGTIVSRPFTCVGGAVHRPMRGEEGEKGWG